VQFLRYDNTKAIKADVLPVLLENEAQNNLLISIITESKARFASNWLLATITGGDGRSLTAICVKPFNLLLYESGNIQLDGAVEMLVRELRRIECAPPGVVAERGLARRFSEAYCADGAGSLYMTITAMRLDSMAEHENAPGFCRELRSSDMFFAPYWERAFSEDCRSTVFTIADNHDRLKTRLGKGTHYIWENGVPVSQAVHGRDTINGAVINGVYTPPQFRGRGYAGSVVGELSDSLLKRGKAFCCLFADAGNLTSCLMYRRLGYYDVCELEDIRFC
jgi:hypothetical protein